MYKNLGDSLIQSCAVAKSSIILVAPFIKEGVMDRLLEVISSNVSLTIVTRWIPEEILAGVNDLEVWELLKNHPQSSLYLRQNLHAKYYRCDESCLIGSANLTAQALGWKHVSNLEILLQKSFQDESLQAFEVDLLIGSIQVNETIYLEYIELVKLLSKEIENISIQLEEPFFYSEQKLWLPILRNPEELYLAYSDQWSRLTTVARDLAKKELSNFKIVQGLSQDTFNLYIALFLKQTKIVQEIDEFIEVPRRFGEVKKFLGNLFDKKNIDVDIAHTWQTLMRWLLYFLPNRYSCKVFNYSEIFYRIQK